MARSRHNHNKERTFSSILENVQRAFSEFLLIPTCTIAFFFILAIGSYALDVTQTGRSGAVRHFLQSLILTDSSSTSSLLGAIAAGVITMTSITISLLLIAVQQSAGSLTGQVYDQFLRRKSNQIYFGFFIGLALYSLLTLATVSERFNPVYGAAVAFIGTVVSPYLLILLLYTTINQMRPIEIIEAIHGHVLSAGEPHRKFIERTRRASTSSYSAALPILTEEHGYLTRVDLDSITESIKARGELTLMVPIGAYVAFGDVIAVVRAETADAAAEIVDACRQAMVIERQRDILLDPAYGLHQLEMIAWTSVSTSKSNPAPGLIIIQCLRDVMARWAALDEAESPSPLTVPVVYTEDVFGRLLSTFETIAIVSSESMQHQIYIEVLRTFTLMFERLPADRRDRAEDLIRRILSALGDHVLTFELESALAELARKLADMGRTASAAEVSAALSGLRGSIGKLGSRSTRAGAG